MSDARVFGQTSLIGRSNENDYVGLRAFRDGASVFAPWYQALVMEGMGFQVEASSGTLFTALTLLAFGSYADTAKTLYVDVPDGKAVIPIEVFGQFQTSDAAIVHGASFVSGILNGVGGTETLVTPHNLCLANQRASGVTAAHTADSEADNINGTEIMLMRLSSAQDIDGVALNPRMHWLARKQALAPIIMDAGSINVVLSTTVSATEGTGFSFASWLEFSESWIS